MGIYLNPGAEALRLARASKIYVDKSAMLQVLDSMANTLQRYVCVSRPRRFGKTMAADMVSAYYDRTVDGASAFAGLAVAQAPDFDEARNRNDVIRINMIDFLGSGSQTGEIASRLSKAVLWDLLGEYPDVRYFDDTDLSRSMADVYLTTKRKFVVVIDEWDCVMREAQGDLDAQKAYLDFLRFWLKDKPHIALVYMTGILPIKKYGKHSALNMFDEYSMTGADQLAPYVGFSEDEVRSLCADWGRGFIDCRAWYDGYRVPGAEGAIVEAYNPRAVVASMLSGNFRSYWSQTETNEALKRYIDLDMDGLHEKAVRLVAGGRVEVSTRTYANDMTTLNSADDVLTLLIHLGYLTFEPAGDGVGEAFVPNREVMGEFAASVKDGGNWDEVARSIRESDTLLDALVVGDAGAVAVGVEQAHEDAASIISYNNESDLAATLRLAFFSAIRRWRLVREAPAGKGFADLTLIPLASAPAGTPGVVIELKYDDTPEAAMAQIRERGYDHALSGLVASGNVLLCGIGYDAKGKRHRCMIERA